VPTKTENEKDEKRDKRESHETREKTEAREMEHHLAKRSLIAKAGGPLSDQEREYLDKRDKEERERWQKPPEPEYSKENLAILGEFAKKANEIRKLLNDRKWGMSLPVSSRFVGMLAGVVNMARGLGIEALEDVIEPIPREGHIAHSTDPPMSLAYAPPGVNPTPWVPQEPLDRLGLGPDARLLTSDTAEAADGGGSIDPPPTQQDPAVAISPTSAPQGSGGVVLHVTGTATNFAAGQTQVTISGSGVNHGTVKVNSATSLDVPVTVFNEAATGDRTITVTTGSETASATFSVTTP
jgi:hypothetical protein